MSINTPATLSTSSSAIPPWDPNRHYDLDWLRVLVFGLLILYHVGMMYVAWSFHIESEHHSELLEDIMLLVNRWRLPLLFFIAGAALRWSLERHSHTSVISTRSRRLIIPLVMGILLIVPPQVYFEMLYTGETQVGYLSFYGEYLDKDSPIFAQRMTGLWGHMTWNHLWFLPYLWCYCALVLLCRSILPSRLATGLKSGVEALKPWTLLLLLALPLFAYGMWLKPLFPKTHALTDDWYTHARYFTVFLYGFAFACAPILWQRVMETRRRHLILAILCYAAMIWMRHLPDDFEASTVEIFIAQYIVYLNGWAWILALLGYARRYLNGSTANQRRWLPYLSEGVYPYYVFHQSVMISVAYPLFQLHLGPVIEPILIILATLVGSALGFELIRHFAVSRWLFGLSVHRRAATPWAKDSQQHSDAYQEST